MLTQADTAKTKTSEAGAKEKVQIAVAGSWGENGFDAEEFKTEVGRFGGEITPSTEKFPIKVTVDGQNFEVSEEGVVTEKGKSTSTTPPPGGDTVTPGEKVTGSNKTYENNGTAVIPVGFAIVPGLEDVSEGLVISDKENDINNEGNQFVWIPVTDPNNYVRNLNYKKSFVGDITYDVDYLPTFNDEDKAPEGNSETEKEKNLVTSQGGFYVSRYEAGDGSVKAERTSETDGILVSKKDAYVYNFIKQEEAKEKAKTFINNKNVKSGLITGIQWDMVMAFVNGKDNYDVTTYSPARHFFIQQAGKNEADKVCNIYDLEGNCYEYVAERNSTSIPYIRRGGYYNSKNPASYRSIGVYADRDDSFRFALYVM